MRRGKPKEKMIRIEFSIPENSPAGRALLALEGVEFKSASLIVRSAVMVLYGNAPGLVGNEYQRLAGLFERMILALEQRPVLGVVQETPEPELPTPPAEPEETSLAQRALQRSRRSKERK